MEKNEDQPTKPKTKPEVSTGHQKKKRPGQRQRRRNKINKSTATAYESTLELLQTDAGRTDGPQILTLHEFSISELNDLNSAVKAEIHATSPAALKSSSNLDPIIEAVQLKSSNLKKSETLQTANNSLQYKNNSGFKEQLVEGTIAMSTNPAETNPAAGKSREEIMAEREAKKLAKQAKKVKSLGAGSQTTPLIEPVTSTLVASSVGALNQEIPSITTPPIATNINPSATVEKTREQIKAEREVKKKAKQALKEAKAAGVPEITAQLDATKITTKLDPSTVQEEKKKPTLSKSERRALQEAQRAAKAQKNATAQRKSASAINAKQTTNSSPSDKPVKTSSTIPANPSPTKSVTPLTKSLRLNDCKVRLFNHLEKVREEVNLFLNNPHIHPSIARLGEQYAQRTIVGSNARCIAFLNALKMVIRDFETPPKKEFARSLETTITYSVEHLQKCRPLAVSVSNAYKHIKHVLTQLPTDQPESDLKENLCRFIDTYIENQIGKAAEAISYSVQEKISNGDVILTFGCSSLITYIFEEAQRRRVNFRVIVVDSRPFCEGQELLRRLTVKEIPCSYVLINAISFVMPESTKVLLGAHALLANGYVMARTGTAQVALVAHSFNVPVLVCCETHKFSERSQTDAIVYNELGNPDDLIRSDKCSLTNWQMKGKMSPLNLMYDITPPELVTAVVTEVSILPCTSVPVILRIKPTEIGY